MPSRHIGQDNLPLIKSVLTQNHAPCVGPFGRRRRRTDRAFRSFSQMRVRRQARGCPDRPALSSLSANGRTNGDAGKSTPTPHRSGSRPAPPICGLACTRGASRKSVMILTGTRAADKRRPQLLPLNGRRKLIGAKHASPFEGHFCQTSQSSNRCDQGARRNP